MRTVRSILASVSATKTEEMPESDLPFHVLGRNQIHFVNRTILRVSKECPSRLPMNHAKFCNARSRYDVIPITLQILFIR